jgi:hypothetical protein
MAKLFKTISLEDRLRGSSYNELPHVPNPVNQGSIDLKQVDKGEKLPTAQLKLTPRRDEANSQILKLTLTDRSKTTVQPLRIMDNKPISKIARPFVNTRFRSAISLENRLKQTTLGSTAHLPQFFLSDIFTDYITIKPFEVFNHTSNIVLVQPTTTINQGSITLRNLEFDSLIAQGTSVINNTYTSFTHILVPTYDSLLLQGTVFSNSVYTSLVSIINSKPVGAIFQGLGTNPTIAVSTPFIYALQGSSTTTLSAPIGSLTGPSPVTITPSVAIPIVVPASIVITNVTFIPTHGGTDPIPYLFEPDRTAPILKVLRYAADRALAFFTPRVKHGSANISTQFVLSPPQRSIFYHNFLQDGSVKLRTKSFQEDPFDPGKFYTNQARKEALTVLKLTLTGDQIYNGSTTGPFITTSLYDYIRKLVLPESTPKIWNYDKVGTAIVSDDKYIKALGANAKDNVATALQTKNIKLDADPSQIAIDSKEGSNLAIQEKTSPLNNYKTLTYGQIQTRAKAGLKGVNAPDFRESLTHPTVKYIGGKAPSNYKSVEVRSPLSANTDSDFIDLTITSKRGSGAVKFKAFITSFSDSFNMSWNDINYVGRQDTLKSFKGVTRGGSIGFKVAALSEGDMAINFAKLNSLVKIAAMGSGTGADNYVQGPMCSITVGRWFTNTPCIFNSIKYDIQTAEYSWDIDNQMPQLVDVSLDFVVLGDTSGKPLNASSNDYFNYIG